MCIGVLALIGLLVPSTASSSPTQDGRVINGNAVSNADTAANGRWSAVVGLLVDNGGGGSRLCTGTLIAPSWVATAAHCVAEQSNASVAVHPSRVTVIAGATAIDGGGTALRAHTVHVHRGFSWSNASWDAALISLTENAPQTPFALPDAARATAYSVGSADNVAGFGRTVSNDPSSTSVLHSGRMEPVDPAECEAGNPGSGAYADCYTPGRAGEATCYGDSGGPIVRFDPARGGAPVLWGITSTGPEPCHAGVYSFAPGYETRVLAVADWFRATMAAVAVPAGRSGGATATTGATPRTGQAGSEAGVPDLTRRVGADGIGIGIYRVKVARRSTGHRTGRVTVTASLVGTAGRGIVELQRRSGKKWRNAGRKVLAFRTAGATGKVTLRAPRCEDGRFRVRIRAFDAAGAQRGVLTETVKVCS